MINLAASSNEVLDEFRKELWKDQRILSVEGEGERQRFIKNFNTKAEAADEQRIMRLLETELGGEFVPHIYQRRENKLVMDYLKGVRIFNLFVDLDNLSALGNSSAARAKEHLFKRCLERQKKIQGVLRKNVAKFSVEPYPVADKILSIMRILSQPLSIHINWNKIEFEIKKMERYWKSVANTPFRDATTKNMVLCAHDLWMGDYSSEEERRKKIETDLRHENPKWLSAPILDFDFSSVPFLTTPEDDPISFLLHERSWQGSIYTPKDLIWLNEDSPDPYRAAVTVIIRYFRFGGRKLGYRLLHPRAHGVRFRYDHGEFYFQRLAAIIEKWSPEVAEDYRGILDFSSMVGSVVADRIPAVDLFLSRFSEKKRAYYSDMYPD